MNLWYEWKLFCFKCIYSFELLFSVAFTHVLAPDDDNAMLINKQWWPIDLAKHFFASLRGQKALKNAKTHNFLHHYFVMLPHSYKYSHWQWNFWVRQRALSWIRSIVISCRIVDLSFLHYAGCISIYLWKIRWSAKSFYIENWHLNEVIDFRIKVTSAIYWLIYISKGWVAGCKWVDANLHKIVVSKTDLLYSVNTITKYKGNSDNI